MTRLTIICHAATEAMRAARFPVDEDVDDGGAASLARTAPTVAGRRLSGPERRATTTATALFPDRGVAIDRDLRDWDCGRWRGLNLEDLQRTEPAGLAAWSADAAAAPHGGESLEDLLTRVESWLDRQAAAGGRTAAVTHPAVLRAAVVAALDAGPAAFRHIDAGPLCRARFSHDGRRWMLQGLAPG